LIAALMITQACNRAQRISGEYRTGAIDGALEQGVDVGDHYDFRSDGTYTCISKINLLGINQSIHAKGTYTIEGNKLLLTRTSWTHYSDDGEDTHTDTSHKTLTIE